MTVGSEVFWQASIGNGVTTTFGFSMPLTGAADLVVLLDGVEAAGNYTVVFTDPDDPTGGGNVIFDPTFQPGSGVEVLRIRRLEYLQELTLQSQGPFNAKVIERAFDRVVMLTQQVSQRAPLISETDLADGFDTEIAGPLTPGYALVVNAVGDGFNFAATLTGATVSAAWAAVIEEPTLASGLSAAGLGAEDSPTFAGLTLSGQLIGSTATIPTARLTNTTDAINLQVLQLHSDRATPANNDLVTLGFFLSDSAGNQDEFMRIAGRADDVSSGSEDGSFRVALRVNGAITAKLEMNNTRIAPSANDGLALGDVSLGFSDLCGASGFTFNIANGNWVMTHTSGVQEVTTGAFAARAVQVTGVGGETLAAATHRNRMLLLDGDITMDDALFTAGDYGMLIGDGTNRTVTRAAGTTMYVNGVDSATATVPAHTVGGYVWETAAIVHLTGSIF